MITTADVRDFVKGFGLAEHYYIGKLDNKPDKSFGFYTLGSSGPPLRMVGTAPTFEIIGVSILIHWNDNAKETEQAARELFRRLYTEKNIIISDHTVYMIDLLTPEPQDVGTDSKGIYERVIELKIFYERKD